MNYHKLLERLFNLNISGGVKFGLQNMERLMIALNHPERSFETIHIAGSNGKGSVCLKISKALEIEGQKVGLYTSPHLSSFRERMQINGQMISQETVIEYLSDVFSVMENNKIPATFFEATTAAAFLYFAKNKVDVAVIETGLGGRLDATNVVMPKLTVITSICIEHSEILGTTIEQIAIEKGGIIKHGCPIIIGPTVPVRDIKQIAHRQHAELTIVSSRGDTYDAENTDIATAALRRLGLKDHSINLGIRFRPPCRMEKHELSPTLIFDVAHNPDGLRRLFQSLHKEYGQLPLRVVCGFSSNKDISSCIKEIARHATHIHFVCSNSARSASPDFLYSIGKEIGASISKEESVNSGMKAAMEQAQLHHETVLVCGSFLSWITPVKQRVLKQYLTIFP